MLLQMKRRSIIVADVTKGHGANGRKNMGQIVDGQHMRGFTEGEVIPVLMAKGANLGFLKF